MNTAATRFGCVVFWISVAFASGGSASDVLNQFRDPGDGWLDGSKFLLEREFSFLPVPIIITEPAVDAGLGLAGIFFHGEEGEANSAQDQFVAPSVSVLGGAYTGNDSWMLMAGHRGRWRDDSLHYLGAGGYGSINLDYYGGPENLTGIGFEFNGEGFYVLQELLVRLGDSEWWLGANFDYGDLDVNFRRSSEEVDLIGLEGESVNAGLGVVLEHDSRDSIFTPSNGDFLRLAARRFDETLGSDFEYDNYAVGYRGFYPVGNFVIGARGDFTVIDGEAPFYAEPYIKLRGIPAMRYQGETVAVVETEARWDFHPRISAIAFVGVGRAADSASDISSFPSQVSKGLGIRYLAARKMGMRVGLDVAWGPEDTVIYFTVGQSWNF